MHWKDAIFLGWFGASAVMFNGQLLGKAVCAVHERWNTPRYCKECRKRIAFSGDE